MYIYIFSKCSNDPNIEYSTFAIRLIDATNTSGETDEAKKHKEV